MAQQDITPDNLGRDGNPTNPVDLIFPLISEVTLEISQIPSYINKLTKLFDFYDNQLAIKNQQIKNYNLKNEIPRLTTFLVNLQSAIDSIKLTKPNSIVASDQEKLAISDYELITLKIIDDIFDESPEIQPNSTEYRDFSDGTKKQVIIYNKIDSIYLTNRTFARTMAVFASIDTTNFSISPSTLSLIFNIKQIVDKQINSPIPTQLLLCAGNETNLSRIEQQFSIFGFDVPLFTSKVNIQDFLNAYIHPIQEIVVSPKPSFVGCSEQTRKRIDILKGQITLYKLQTQIAGGEDLFNSTERLRYLENKKELIELTKLCPESTSEIAIFENIKDLDKLGKIFTDFLHKYNISCIVDEAIKCVMPQIPCDQILRDLSIDNFESRLKAAFPHQQQIITVIVQKINTNLEEENTRRAEQGQPPLAPAEQSQKILDTINTFIDLEALCKIDIPAIIELIKNILNPPNFSAIFNILDWQFNLKIDFQAAILEALLRTLLDLIQKILNELIGCNALDGLIAGIISNNIQTDSGLYGDLATLFGAGNTQEILNNNLDTFLNQNAEQLNRIIKFESSYGNSVTQTTINSNFGLGTSLENPFSQETQLTVDNFGGLVKTSIRSTGSIGLAGFTGRNDVITEFDVTKLASSEGQKEFLEEIGKFQIAIIDGQQTVSRISDDSVVNISSGLQDGTITIANPPVITQELQQRDNSNMFTAYRIRDKNRHILDALAVINESQGNSSIYVTETGLAEQIKDYVKTCFSLLSPSETIELITGNSSEETKLTITGISQVRYPLLYTIFKYPERHASLFASFGAISGLNTVLTRLQILALDPAVRQKMVDPNVCAPFSDLYDFRKALMQQTLPEDVANNLIDNLLEDDRKRANALIDSLSKPQNISDLLTNPTALNPTKTFDGKQIPETENILDNTIDSILDHIKIAFDKDIDGFPAATSSPKEDNKYIPKNQTAQKQTLFGFQDPGTPEQIENQEWTNISNITGRTEAVFNVKTHKKQTGKLFKDIFESYKTDVLQTGLANRFNIDNPINNNETVFRVSARSYLQQNQQLTSFTASNSNKPEWLIDYSELENGKFKFVVKTTGDVQVDSLPIIPFSEKINFSGNLTDLDQISKTNIINLGIPENSTKLTVFNTILQPNIRNIIGEISMNPTRQRELFVFESNKILEHFIEQSLRAQNFIDSKLLEPTSISNYTTEEQNKAILLDLIDFSPRQTDEQRACGIDTHILQLEIVKQRIKKQFNDFIPEDLISKNSRVNTRYTDNKPGRLSKQLMFALTDIFIRTSVIHNIFKGLFIFDKFKYNLSSFSYPYIIYLFIESRVQKDIKELELQQDFELEYEKIVQLYLNENLIDSEQTGTNFSKIVKYHVDTVLKFLNKLLVNSTSQNLLIQQNPILNSIDSPIQINPNLNYNQQSLRQQKNEEFLQNIITKTGGIRNTYSFFYDFEPISIRRDLTRQERRQQGETDDSFRATDITETVYLGIPKTFGGFTNFTSNSNIDGASKITFVLEKYVSLEFEDAPPYNLDPNDPLFALFNQFKNSEFLNGIVNITNFEEMYKNIIQVLYTNRIQSAFPTGTNYATSTILYTENPEQIRNRWFKSKPKFGLRLCLQKDKALNNTQVSNNGFLDTFPFEKDDLNINVANNFVFTENKKMKMGQIQSIQLDRYPYSELIIDEQQRERIRDYIVAVPLVGCTIIPLIEKELEINYNDFFDPDLFEVDLINTAPRIQEIYNLPQFLNNLKTMIVNDPKFDLLVNYCLDINIGNTLALFNSLVGMNNEPMYKLLNNTKNVIKKNFIIHKNSGNFRNRGKNGAYNKQKDSKINGPPSLEFLKAAATIPISILKGLATAVDPNIFLADKVVLAGKMGFIQPKYKRFTAGEEILEVGTDQTFTVEQDGIANDGDFIIEDGLYKIKPQNQRTGGGNPLPDYIPVAQTRNINNKIELIKDQQGKVMVKYGLGYEGIPWDPKTDTAVDPNFDENDITSFDVKISSFIFPGESINIPYKVASLALAPFPLFTPGLTAYNVAMPFGPLFLAFEDLLAQNPQFKFAVAKKKETDTGSNLNCEDNSQNTVDNE